jgi:ketosteroid isomerase-like protein
VGEGNVETARRFVEAIDRRDRAAIFACLAPGVIWQTTGLLAGEPRAYQGREELWAYVRSLDGDFEDLRFEPEQMDAVGNLVVTKVHLRGTVASTGEPADLEFSTVASFRDGRIVRVDNYTDHAEALTDAELKR